MQTQPELRPFAEFLRREMISKGLNASRLAKAVFGTHVDSRGYTVSRNRDRISLYLRAQSRPSAATAHKLTVALGLEPWEMDLMLPPTRPPVEPAPPAADDAKITVRLEFIGTRREMADCLPRIFRFDKSP